MHKRAPFYLLSLYALALWFCFFRKSADFFTFAGNWHPSDGDALNIVNHLLSGLRIYGDRASELILTSYPPLFHLVMAFVKALGVESVGFTRGFNLVLLFASSLLIGDVVRREVRLPLTALLIPSIVHLVFEASLSQAVFLQPDAWLVFFLSLSFWGVVTRRVSIPGVALACAAALLVKQSGWVAPVFSALILYKTQQNQLKRFVLWFGGLSLAFWLALLAWQGWPLIESVWLTPMVGSPDDQDTARGVVSLHQFAYQGRGWVVSIGVLAAIVLGLRRRAWFWLIALLIDGLMLSRVARNNAGEYLLWFQYLLLGGAISHAGLLALSHDLLSKKSARRLGMLAGWSLVLVSLFWHYGRGLFKSAAPAQFAAWRAEEQTHSEEIALWVQKSRSESGPSVRWASSGLGLALAQQGVLFDQEWCALKLEFSADRTSRGHAWVERFKKGDYQWVQWSESVRCAGEDPIAPVLKQCFEKQGSTQALWLGAPHKIWILKYVGCESLPRS